MARARIKFLTPKAKILAQVAKPRGQEFFYLPKGKNFYLQKGKNFILSRPLGQEQYSCKFDQ